jgi:hypothetical protein
VTESFMVDAVRARLGIVGSIPLVSGGFLEPGLNEAEASAHGLRSSRHCDGDGRATGDEIALFHSHLYIQIVRREIVAGAHERPLILRRSNLDRYSPMIFPTWSRL